jgi:hypothetical protein
MHMLTAYLTPHRTPHLTFFFAVVVAAAVMMIGTHYQFLWYVARVFLPGRKRSCRLSALIKLSEYADILSQKVR